MYYKPKVCFETTDIMVIKPKYKQSNVICDLKAFIVKLVSSEILICLYLRLIYLYTDW